MKILVIEDNLQLREVTQLLLESCGYEVVGAEGAAQGLALLRATRPNLVLLDLMMPDMDGFQFREQQLADPELADIPVVVWSGHYLSPSDSRRLQGATVIAKPIDPDVVLRTIAVLLGPSA